ncbi:N-acetyltransferase [bacterium]|nr:N-acetyltransferase [bacterium]
MSNVEIISVRSKSEWKKFLKFPYQHYKDYPNWAPPLIIDQKFILNPKKHPFYDHGEVQLFLAVQHNKIVGRVAAIIDHLHIKIHKEKIGFFGFFETVDDINVSSTLLETAEKWLTEHGMQAMRGPINLSMNESSGLLINAFDDSPRLLMTYNPEYYIHHIESYGLKKEMDLFAYHVDGKEPPPAKLVRVAERIEKKQNVTIRPVNMKVYNEEIERIWDVYNKAWSKNWGFVPWTEAEFKHLAKDMKTAIIPDMALIVEKDGEPIAFSVTLPDMNKALIKTNGRLFPTGLLKLLYYRRKINWSRILVLGVVHEFQGHGIDALLYLKTWKNTVKKGYYNGEMSWILENNTMMNRAATMLGGKLYKTYRIYEKPCK